MAAAKTRFDDQPAYVLHSWPFRETSLIVEVFSLHHGRVALVARGARRPKSAVRGTLMAFQPLRMSWFGKQELRTLHHAEWEGGMPRPQGESLIYGLYLNELLLKLLPRDDPHEALYEHYQDTLRLFSSDASPLVALRRFELALLRELGYGLSLTHTDTGEPIQAETSYVYVVEHGVSAAGEGRHGVQLRGKTLLDMAQDDYADPQTQQQSKVLMRHVIGHYLGGGPLYTRQLLKELQTL